MQQKQYKYTVNIPLGYKQAEKGKGTVVRKAKKVLPNSPCPCGSGKKAKHCHWQCGKPSLSFEYRFNLNYKNKNYEHLF